MSRKLKERLPQSDNVRLNLDIYKNFGEFQDFSGCKWDIRTKFFPVKRSRTLVSCGAKYSKSGPPIHVFLMLIDEDDQWKVSAFNINSDIKRMSFGPKLEFDESTYMEMMKKN